MKTTRIIIMSMLVSFGTFALAGDSGIRKLGRLQGYLNPNAATATTTMLPTDGAAGGVGTSVWTPQALFGWMALFVFLTILSDFDATAQLADAFAILILITTELTVGPDAFANINKLLTKGP